MHLSFTDKDILFSRLEKKSLQAGNCLEWSGYIRPNGYGRLTYKQRQFYPHRISYFLFHGPLSSDLDVCHSCDNRKCISPTHLFAGTRKENMADAAAKGRTARGSKLSKKLSETDVLFIRKCELSSHELAKKFNICPTNVRAIRRRKTWKHV